MAGFFTVPERTAFTRFMDGMAFGRALNMFGKPHFVLPTTDYASYAANAWVRNHNHSVYASVKLAHDACVSGRGDAIVLLPGVHTVSTASLALSKTAVKFYGAEYWAGQTPSIPAAILTTDITGDEIGNITAPDIGMYGLTIRPITASDAFDFSAAAHNLHVDGCHIDLYTPVVNIATAGFTAGGAATGAKFTNSQFISDGAQGLALTMTATTNGLIQGNVFRVTAGSWAAAILCGAATAGLEIDNNRFQCSGTAMTVGVDGTGATITGGVFFNRNLNSVLVTKVVDNFDSGECELGINYIMTVGGGTGGTLVTATT